MFEPSDLTIFLIQDISAEIFKQKSQKREQDDLLFIANVAHDLRTPLNALKGNNDIINMSLCH